MNSLPYCIYKGIAETAKWGAMQFRFVPPHYRKGKDRSYDGVTSRGEKIDLDQGWKAVEGTVILEITSSKGNNVYDWENKIIISLNDSDIAKILGAFLTGEEAKIMHDPNAQGTAQGTVKKYLAISSPQGPAVGMMFTATQIAGQDKKVHTVPINRDEVIILKILLEAALPKIFGW